MKIKDTLKFNRLSICLIKEGIVNEGDILKSFAGKIEITNVGTFYFQKSQLMKPSWISDFFEDNIDEASLLTSSASGLLLTTVNYKGKDIVFAIPFGIGRFMLKENIIEERFGLKVTLNSVESGSIKSIERKTLGAFSKISREQLSKASDANAFGLDIEQDLVKAVTGISRYTDFGNIISGADILSVSAPVTIKTIKKFLEKCYEQYISKEYLKNFDWIDQIQEVKSKSIIDSLYTELIKKINNREFEKVWMAVPDLINWSDLKGFKYIPREKELQSDIDIAKFVDSFSEPIDSVEKIKNRAIVAFSASTEKEMEHWSAHKCIYGEVELSGKQYIISNGKWYEIENDFVKRVNNNYNSMPISSITLPDFNHDTEEKYTIDTCSNNSTNFLNLDRQTVVYGGGRSRIEFCDIFTKDNKLIHIKPYGASAVLSHLFQQGLVSGEVFASDADFRKELNKKLKHGWKLSNSSAKIKASDYEIVYAIISNHTDSKPNIPFFSKVTIKNARRRLEGMNYNVSIAKINSTK